jgi:ankyrin repeat protein
MAPKYFAALVLFASYSAQSMDKVANTKQRREDIYVMCMAPMMRLVNGGLASEEAWMTLVDAGCSQDYCEAFARQNWKKNKADRRKFKNIFCNPQLTIADALPTISYDSYAVGDGFVVDMMPHMLKFNKIEMPKEVCKMTARLLWQEDAELRMEYQKYFMQQALAEHKTLADLPSHLLNIIGAFTKRSGKATLKCVSKALDVKIIAQSDLHALYREANKEGDKKAMNQLQCYSTFTPEPKGELFDAIKDNNMQLVKHCIAQVKGHDDSFSTLKLYKCIKVAMERGSNADIVKMLIAEEKAISGQPLTLWAEGHDNVPLMRFLVAHGVDINRADGDGNTALTCAAQSGKVKFVKELITYPGIDINKRDRDGKTALIAIAPGTYNVTFSGRYDEIARALLAAGAKVNVADKYGETALTIAAQNDRKELVKLLCDYGAVDKNSHQPALEWFVSHKKHDMAELLLGYGANVNTIAEAYRNNGATVLILAIQNNDPEMAKLLINAGADVNIKDKKGKTALMHARDMHCSQEVIKLLEERDAGVIFYKDLRGMAGITGLSVAAVTTIAWLFGR